MPPHLQLVCACLVLSASIVGPSRVHAQRVHRVFLGYYAAFGGLEVEQIPFDEVTHLSHAFLALDDQGKVLKSDRVPSKALVDAAHQHRVKVLLSVGGGKTTLGLAKAAADKEQLRKLVAEIVEVVAGSGYDGVDLNWEFPSDRKTRQGFTELVKELRDQLDAQATKDSHGEYLLTAALPPSGRLGKYIDSGAVQSRVDWFNLAAYDMSGPWEKTAGHHAPLFASPYDPDKSWRSVSSAVEYWSKERGVPVERLVVGLPMYGRLMPVKQPHEPLDPEKRDQHGAMDFREIRQLAGKDWTAMWDDKSKVPWLRSPEGDRLVCYDDRNSIHSKAD
ncbi:MAG: glycoside hydrolase family 18 protein, partial [Planctomycetales bacterium]|nr:glycoside hydrolase family 18 protein [Planctomycetales bacterium]